jgi:hypothetical protein
VLALSRADAALSELSGLGRQLPEPYLLIDPYLRQEAVLSSRERAWRRVFVAPEIMRAIDTPLENMSHSTLTVR